MLILWLAAAAFPALAGDDPGSISPWRFAGYGTIARSWDDNSNVAPIRDVSQRPGDTFAEGPTWKLDSRVAIQASYRPTAGYGALVQLVAREQVDDSLLGAVEMAYGEWSPDGARKWRAGRFGYDAFLMSDHRNLGYSYNAVRPPPEFYGWVPLFSVDGVDVAQDWHRDGGLWRLKAQLGQNRTRIPTGDQDYRFRSDYIWSVTLLREMGPWRFKTGLSAFKIATEPAAFAPLHGGLEAVAAATAGSNPDISAEAAGLRTESAFRDARINYLTVGGAYDDGQWLIQAEFGHTDSTHTIVPAGNSGYLSAGYRLGSWTPYVTGSFSHPRRDPVVAVSDWSLIGQGALQTSALFVLNSTRIDQNTLSLGVRWDLLPAAAVKLQWDRSWIDPSGYALWFRSIESNNRASTVNLLTLGVDFLF